jgi:hypothetical protein
MHRSPRPHRFTAPRLLALLALVALTASLAACESSHGLNLVPDQPPTVTITSGPIDTVSAPQSWLVDIHWDASDPDGRIDHFEYAIDPPTQKRARMAMAETAWVRTQEYHVVARFRATRRDSVVPGATASDFHIFVLRAVDDRGGISPDVVRGFYAYTVAPDVGITRPVPSQFLSAFLPVPFAVEWSGDDPDGADTHQPAFYRTRLLSMDNGANQAYLLDPDSLWRQGAASGWEGWRTIAGDTTALVITSDDVPVGGSAALAVLAVDEAGATTPYLQLSRNFLRFNVSPPGADAPRIHIFSALEDFTYPSGGFFLDPSREIPVEVGAGVPLEFHFDGIAAPGRVVLAARWMVDGNPGDESPRANDDDIAHWSQWAAPPGVASFTLHTPNTHRLFVEVRDDFGGLSLGIVRILCVTPSFTSELLVVDDTRLEVDRFVSAGTPGNYTKAWPSRAEMDTFLFARGGVPWRGTRNPATGVISPPGLLAGYSFDTLGTRLGLEDPSRAVTLDRLAHFRHVIWLVDFSGAANGNGSDPTFPITTLRAMSQPGRLNALEQYVQLGGQVWLAGGGAAFASLINFDSRANNSGQLTVFDVANGELGPGRILYDAAHIRSAIGVTRANLDFARSPAAVGGWSGHGPDGTLAAPDYSHAPATMRRRDQATDPIPPTRLPGQTALYYPTSFAAGFVLEPNVITEDFDPDPNVTRIESALDTVYDVSGVVIPNSPAPVMTYYHGRDNAPFVYTGFEPWDFTRADCQGLVDFVLGDVWKLAKSPPGAGARAAGVTPAPALRITRAPEAAHRARVQMRR